MLDKHTDHHKKWQCCMEICDKFADAKEVYQRFESERDIFWKESNVCIGNVMERLWGYSAMHIGDFPKDWVKPGGLPQMDYRTTVDAMCTSENVLQQNELKTMKCLREEDLLKRRVNIANHIETH